MRYIIAIDQSTQGTKAMLIDERGSLAGRADLPHRQIVSENGWVEHDGEEIARNLLLVVGRLLESSAVPREQIVGVGIANQRESVLVWDRKTGRPICNSIVWQCSRAGKICEALAAGGADEYVHQTSGLRLSPFFSGPKISWVLENVCGAREKAARGELLCGTMDCWSIYTLTGGAVHKTDCSNASRTMLMNLKQGCWDEGLCTMFGIPQSMLPEICDSDALFGETDFGGLLDHPIPIHAAIGDSHAALFAYGCHERGSCMTGYGTGSCVMMNLGTTPTLSQNGLSTSVAWRSMGETHYLFDGVVNYSGAVITWLCSELGLAKSPAETAELALRAHPADQTYLVPAFTGLGAPHWSNRANAIFCGMTRLTSRAELVRAALECIAYQISDILLAMSQDAGIVPDAMRVSGGPTKNCYLMQFQSDILGYPVLIPENEEMTCLGAAYLAGQALGVYDKAFIANGPPSHTVYQPAMSEEVRREKLTGWQQAVCLALGTETRSGNED